MAGENIEEEIVLDFRSKSRSEDLSDLTRMDQNPSKIQDLVPCKEGAASHKKPTMETHPTEILMALVANMNRCTSVCFGLTCSRIYSVHFRLNGPTPLHLSTRRKARSWIHSEEMALKYLIGDRMTRCKYPFCLKHFIYVPKGSA